MRQWQLLFFRFTCTSCRGNFEENTRRPHLVKHHFLKCATGVWIDPLYVLLVSFLFMQFKSISTLLRHEEAMRFLILDSLTNQNRGL